MGIFTRFTLRSLARNRTRTIVSLIGVILSCALITAIYTTVTSLEGAFLASVIEREGTWQVFDPAAEEGFEEKLLQSPSTEQLLACEDLGSARMVWEDDPDGFSYLEVHTMPRVIAGDDDAMSLVVMPTIDEGRFPAAADEIALPKSLRGAAFSGIESGGQPSATSDGPVELGTTLTLPLGTRVGSDGRRVFGMTEDFDIGKNGTVTESLESVETSAFTVVGFYDDQHFTIEQFAAGSSSFIAIAGDAGQQGIGTCAWLSTSGFSSRDKLVDFADGVFGNQGYYLHTDLLSYQGLYGTSAVWRTLFWFATLLATIIGVAAISLIYNSFAISVAERTRQFGLLSSLGASRRQLRRTVYVEALALFLVGAPLGVGLGILGVRLTLIAISSTLAHALGFALGGGSIPVTVKPAAIALACAILFVVMAVSAAIPAIRASRVSAVDAIRQSRDVRLDRKTTRKLAKASAKGIALSKPRGLSIRLFGLPGLLAQRNSHRAGSKGRVVVLSLGLSVMLLVTAGTIRKALTTVVEIEGSAFGGASTADIVVGIYNDAPAAGLEREVSTDLAGVAASAQDGVSDVEGVEFQSTLLMGSAELTLPAGTIDYDAHGDVLVSDPRYGVHADGSYNGMAVLYFVPDALWEELAGSEATEGAAQALLLNVFSTTDSDNRYVLIPPYAKATTATAYAFEPRDGYSRGTLILDDDGELKLTYESNEFDGNGTPVDTLYVSPDQAAETTRVDIVGMVDEQPEALAVDSAVMSFPVLIMPQSQVGSFAALPAYRALVSYGLTGDQKPLEVEDQLFERLSGLNLSERFSYFVRNYAEEQASMRAVYDMLNLFIFLFSFITMLIAVANVFNTLYNNIILRTREFAVLQSCGMDGRAFARMLFCECAGYAAKALALGLGLAFVVAFFMDKIFEISFETGAGLPIHWGYVFASIAGVIVVLAISVAYALRRSHALNVVEALRADAI